MSTLRRRTKKCGKLPLRSLHWRSSVAWKRSRSRTTLGSRRQDGHDRCDRSQSAPHGVRLLVSSEGQETVWEIVSPTDGLQPQEHQAPAVTDANGRPLSVFMTAGEVSDYSGAAASLDGPPKSAMDAGRPGQCWRLVPRRLSGKRHYPLSPRPLQGLAPRCNALRRGPKAFFSTTALAASATFWLGRSIKPDPSGAIGKNGRLTIADGGRLSWFDSAPGRGAPRS